MTWPEIQTVGFDGYLVRFGDRLSEASNRAALAFRDAVDRAQWDCVSETSTSLVSTYVRFDALEYDSVDLLSRLEALTTEQDWFAAALPSGRRFWRVPTVFGGEAAPQLAEAAKAAGFSEREAVASLSSSRVRVQTIGFAPGMPYLGSLPEAWDIPRQTELTAQIPAGGLCVALRQLVLFPVATPTGWRQVGQTAFQLFRPMSDAPFVLRPGDEVQFDPVSPEELADVQSDPDGGATAEVIL